MLVACAMIARSNTNNMSVEKLILRPPCIKNFIISIYSTKKYFVYSLPIYMVLVLFINNKTTKLRGELWII